MIKQEIIDTFVFEENGKFGVTNPTNFDLVIGYYDNKGEAESVLRKFINDEQIVFEDGSEH
jgi:hypothetical protein